ncbi:MAG: hypothetical protein MJZ34_10500 [Paludibacteraceae bacterium]|nr:hypothetical protein [Paludibacteraceae bacterium]
MKKIFIIILVLVNCVFAINTLKYNGKTDAWSGKWQMKAVYDYKVKYSAWSGEETGYFVKKTKCEVVITVFGEENLVDDSETTFKMSYSHCPHMDSAVVSAYDGNTWIGDFHRTKAEETSYTNVTTSYFGIKMLKNITRLTLYPKVDNERHTYESVGLHCNDGYEPSKGSWEKDYYCLNSDSLLEYKCNSKKGMKWYNGSCVNEFYCEDGEYYDSICVTLPSNATRNKKYGYTCNSGYVENADEHECVKLCNENEVVYKYDVSECVEIPSNSHKLNLKYWECDSGYVDVHGSCELMKNCSNTQYYDSSDNACYERTKPLYSTWNDTDHTSWTCDDSYFEYEGDCYLKCRDAIDEKEVVYFDYDTKTCVSYTKNNNEEDVSNEAVEENASNETEKVEDKCGEGYFEYSGGCYLKSSNYGSKGIDFSFVKNKSHLYFDLDMGASYGYSKYYETSTGIGFGITLGYNFVAELVNGFQIGFNANATLIYDEWEVEKQTTSYYYEGENNDDYGALTIGGGVYVKLFNFLSYTGYLMLPLIDNDFDDGYVNIKGMIGNKFAIEGEHNSIYFKYVYGDKYLSYKSIGWSFRW